MNQQHHIPQASVAPDTPTPTALITGGAKGIGRAIALALAADGFNIALNYHSSHAAAQETAAAIAALGHQAQLLPADLADPLQVEQLVKNCTELMEAPTVLVCNAGIMYNQLAAFTRLEDWHNVMRTNLDAAFLLTKAVARPMARRKSGRIIYVSSVAGIVGDLMRSAYSASKAGLFGLAKSVARELAPSNVTVNVVAPGIITTDMTVDIPESRRAKQLAAIPMGRFGTPEEVANCVRFLASQRANWITGQTLCVDGGMCMREL